MVDDDPSVTETSCRVLQLEGFTVYSALSPTGGLELASDKLPDAIELDLRMPILSGVRFLELLRERPALEHTPVAIVTGDYFGLHRHDVADRGARGVGAFQADLDGRSRHPRQRPMAEQPLRDQVRPVAPLNVSWRSTSERSLFARLPE